MAGRRLSVLVLILVVFSMNCVLSCKPPLPLVAPQLTSVDIQGPGTNIILTFRTHFTINEAVWGIYKEDDFTVRKYILKTTKGPITQSVQKYADGYRVSLNSEKHVGHVYVWLTFQIGCAKFIRFISLNTKGTVTTVEEEAMTIQKIPDTEVAVSPGQELEIEVETKSEYFNPMLKTYEQLYRNETGIFQNWFRKREGMFDISINSTGEPTRENPDRQYFLANARVRERVYDTVMQFSWTSKTSTEDTGRKNIIEYDMFTYNVNYYVDKTWPPAFLLRDCSTPMMDTSRHEGDTLVVKMKTGQLACLGISLDGSPVPEHVLATIEGEIQQSLTSGILGKTSDEKAYILPELAPDQTREYILIMKGSEYILQKIRLEGYSPLKVDTLNIIDVPRSGLVTLRCRAEGDYEELGFYMADMAGYWETEWEEGSQEWQALKTFTPNENKNFTYEYEIELNQTMMDLIDGPRPHEIFCAARSWYQIDFQFFIILFNSTRGNPT